MSRAGKGKSPGGTSPGVIAPPPLIYLACLAAGLALEYFWPAAALPQVLRFGAGAAAIAAGLALAVWAVLQFRKVGTHIDVRKPAIALALSGPYRISRNPMYVALTLFYLGLGLLAGSLWVLILALPALLVMRFGVIGREERYLAGKFGARYLDYTRKVRRWL